MADETTAGIGEQRVPTRWLDTTPIDSTDKPCTIVRLDVDAHASGLYARVSETMQIHNPNPRPISTDVTIALPDGAVVCGYALEIDGQMIDGVVVPKEKARVAFETERRRGADPGLAEAVRGNVYKTRVYPVPANGLRSIRLDYVVPLAVMEDGKATLGLPMPAEEVARRAVRIEIEIPGCERPVIEGLGAEPVEAVGTWVAEDVSTEVRATGPVLVTIPGIPLPLVMAERDEEGDVWFVAAEEVPQSDDADIPELASLVVLWDASGSRAGDDHAAEIELVRSWCAGGIRNITLITFSNGIHEIVQCESADEIVDRLLSVRYDGGTSLSMAARALDTMRGDLLEVALGGVCALFSDGIDTLPGEGFGVPLGCDLLAVVSGGQRDIEGMRQACRGHAVTVDEAPRDAAGLVREFSGAAAAKRVAVSGGGVADALDAGIRGGRIRCALGRLSGDSATIRLGDGGEELEVSADDAREGQVLSRAWAARRVTLLSPSADENAKELQAIGRRFGVASPVTSLLVLETLDQWLRYDICPPKSWEPMWRMWQELQAGRMREDSDEGLRARHLADLERAWKGLLEWHDHDYTEDWENQLRREIRSVREGGERGRHAILDAVSELGDGIGSVTHRLMRRFESRPNGAIGYSEPSFMRTDALADMAFEGADEGMAADYDEGPALFMMAEAAPAMAGAAPMGYQRAAAPSEGMPPAPDATDEPHAVRIRPWMPGTPYLSALDEAAGEDKSDVAAALDAYMSMRGEYAESPSFFLDCSAWFSERGDSTNSLRILTNLAEIDIDNAAMLRVMGWRMREAGLLEQARDVLAKVLALRGEDSQSHRDLALVLSELAREKFDAGWRPDAARLAKEAAAHYRTIALTPWSRRAIAVGLFAVEENNVLRAWGKQDGWGGDAPRIPLISPALDGVLDCDLRITMAWDADDTDIDIHVTEPSGEEAYYAHNRTSSGGRVSEDITDGYGPELYEVRKARPGDYVIRAHYYASHQQTVFGPATCTLTVYTDWGRPGQRQEITTTRLDKERSMVPVGTVSYGAAAVERAESGDAPEPGELPADGDGDAPAPMRLSKGMTEEEVVAVLGEPKSASEEGDERLLRWDMGGRREIRAVLVGGRLERAIEASPWGDEMVLVQ